MSIVGLTDRWVLVEWTSEAAYSAVPANRVDPSSASVGEQVKVRWRESGKAVWLDAKVIALGKFVLAVYRTIIITHNAGAISLFLGSEQYVLQQMKKMEDDSEENSEQEGTDRIEEEKEWNAYSTAGKYTL